MSYHAMDIPLLRCPDSNTLDRPTGLQRPPFNTDHHRHGLRRRLGRPGLSAQSNTWCRCAGHGWQLQYRLCHRPWTDHYRIARWRLAYKSSAGYLLLFCCEQYDEVAQQYRAAQSVQYSAYSDSGCYANHFFSGETGDIFLWRYRRFFYAWFDYICSVCLSSVDFVICKFTFVSLIIV
jgi:hypothetical protein